jgi:N-acetylgalactosamine 4-sulfate 6-O-sulfotransferase
VHLRLCITARTFTKVQDHGSPNHTSHNVHAYCMCRLHAAYWTYGHYWDRYGGKTGEGFQRYVLEQIEGFRNCTDLEGHSTWECTLYLESWSQPLEDIFFHCDQLLRGMYSFWLHMWFSYFPRESFLVLKSEDFFENPRQVLQQVFQHLGLREPTRDEWAAILGTAAIRSTATGQDMLPGAWEAVAEFYKPFNEDLASMLGDDKWLWSGAKG